MLVPAEAPPVPERLGDRALALGRGEHDLEPADHERRAGLDGERLALLRGERPLVDSSVVGAVVGHVARGRLGGEPLTDVALHRAGVGRQGRRVSGSEVGQAAVEAEPVADDDERGAERGAEVADGTAHEVAEHLLVDGLLLRHGELLRLGPPGGGLATEDCVAGVAATLHRRCNRVARCRRHAGAPSESEEQSHGRGHPPRGRVAGRAGRRRHRSGTAAPGRRPVRRHVRASADRRPRILPQGAVGRGGLDHAGHRQHHPLGADGLGGGAVRRGAGRGRPHDGGDGAGPDRTGDAAGDADDRLHRRPGAAR